MRRRLVGSRSLALLPAPLLAMLVLAGCGTSGPASPRTGPATRLAFAGLPASVTNGAPFPIQVQAQRADGSLDPGFTETVRVSLASGPGTLSGTTTRAAVAGMATFEDLVVSAPGTYTLGAASGTLAAATSNAITAAASPPAVIRVGTFTGQNNYTTAGSLEILRDASGKETFRTGADFRVSGGLGSISVWLTDATGASSLNASSLKLRLGTITSRFAGEYSYAIPGGSSGYTHAVTFCEGARVNFGNAPLRVP